MSAARRDSAMRTETQTPDRVDLEGLRGAISAALTRFPIDEPSLREAVSAYADAESRLSTPLGYVIVVLTELVETANLAPFSIRHARTRQLTLWTIERYFASRTDPVSTISSPDADAYFRPSRRQAST